MSCENKLTIPQVVEFKQQILKSIELYINEYHVEKNNDYPKDKIHNQHIVEQIISHYNRLCDIYSSTHDSDDEDVLSDIDDFVDDLKSGSSDDEHIILRNRVIHDMTNITAESSDDERIILRNRAINDVTNTVLIDADASTTQRFPESLRSSDVSPNEHGEHDYETLMRDRIYVNRSRNIPEAIDYNNYDPRSTHTLPDRRGQIDKSNLMAQPENEQDLNGSLHGSDMEHQTDYSHIRHLRQLHKYHLNNMRDGNISPLFTDTSVDPPLYSSTTTHNSSSGSHRNMHISHPISYQINNNYDRTHFFNRDHQNNLININVSRGPLQLKSVDEIKQEYEFLTSGTNKTITDSTDCMQNNNKKKLQPTVATDLVIGETENYDEPYVPELPPTTMEPDQIQSAIIVSLNSTTSISQDQPQVGS